MQNINHINYQGESATKIKTPATLFFKPHAKSPTPLKQNTSPQHVRHQSNVAMCQNHAQKCAMYYTLTDSEKVNFCQKCAIFLASKGYSITKINMQNSSKSHLQRTPSNVSIASSRKRQSTGVKIKNKRQIEIKQFLGQLNEVRNTIAQTKQTIKQKLIQSQQFYGQQMQEINDYFSLIIKSLQLQKHKCYNHILHQRQQAEQNIRQINNQLKLIDQDITKIYLDIEDNIQTVYSIDEDSYNQVISQYIRQQEIFQNSISGLLLTPIQMRKIQFQGIPQSLYNLSDVLIQNSKTQNSQQYRLADSINVQDLSYIKAVSPRGDFTQYNQQHQNYNNCNQPSSLKFSFEAQRLRQSMKNQGQGMYNYIN